MNQLPLYYHPTLVCCVDDNQRFVNSLALSMPDDLCFRSFLTPEQALEYINRQNTESSLAERCFTRDGDVMRLDLNVLEQEIQNPQRFNRLAVLLIDYAMPTMGGLEFCAQVRDPDVRRVLLTGVADEKTAVAAFNQGLIDHYLPKVELIKPGGVLPYVRDQQTRYFQQFLPRLTKTLGVRAPEFTQEPAFIAYFQALLTELHIVEYYLVTQPMGYLLLNSQGDSFRLLVRDLNDVPAEVELMQTYGAPQDLIDRVRSHTALSCFYEHPRDYLGHEPFPWEEFLFPATQFDGAISWLAAVMPEPPTDVNFDAQLCSYQHYLQAR